MSSNIHKHRILILDFGSQYTQLIARRVREAGVFCEVLPAALSAEDTLALKAHPPAGIILSGGPDSVTAPVTTHAPEFIYDLQCPVLGICYGMQTIATQFGGKVVSGLLREFGRARATVKTASALLDGIADKLLDVWMSHGDHVEILPPEFKIIASTDTCEIVGMANEKRKIYGLQFHPEVSHTPHGMAIIERFVRDICGCPPVWTAKNIIMDSVEGIRRKVKKDNVILGLSGGVDSSVLAVLLQQAIGEQLVCVLVNTGLMRLNEIENIQELFAKHHGIRLVTVDAQHEFMSALAGVSDPEEKRKIMGRIFVEVFDREAAKIKNAHWLAQGTIYPDVIESAATGSGKAHVIKSHHNVGGLPQEMSFRLLEPLRELFKDEVRKIGIELGLPPELVWRHPFPGPGLAIRVMGEVRPEYLDVLRHADAILIEELRRHHWYDKVSQAFAVYLPVKSVGVLGDVRHYADVIAIRVVESVDFMTAHAAHLPYELLNEIGRRIVNEVHGVSRVVYDITEKPPATIEWE